MQSRWCVRIFEQTRSLAGIVVGICAASLAATASAHAAGTLADRVNETATGVIASASAPSRPSFSSDNLPTFRLDYLRNHAAPNCQIPLPPVGAISPFPLALRLGATVSPRFLGDVGIDATIGGLHLLPGLQSRVDGDAIISANFGGVKTIIPVTFDQIANLNLPISSRVYLGAGVGPYFADKARLGGKVIVGAEILKKFGLEGNLHFAGIGQTIMTVQARIGL